MTHLSYTKKQDGFIILFSVLITAIILSITLGVANVAFRQRIFTQQVTQSTKAFYAAETALECLVALDARGDFGQDPYPTSMPTDVNVYCNGITAPATPNVSNSPIVGTGPYCADEDPMTSPTYCPGGGLGVGSTVYEFDPVNFSPSTFIEVSDTSGALTGCARARVTKYYDTGLSNLTERYKHVIQVWGYQVDCATLEAQLTFALSNPSSPLGFGPTNNIVERSLTYTYESE